MRGILKPDGSISRSRFDPAHRPRFAIVIPLNVAELVEDELHHPGLMGLGEALENFDKHFATANDTDVAGSDLASRCPASLRQARSGARCGQPRDYLKDPC